jgi:hypothetical protein
MDTFASDTLPNVKDPNSYAAILAETKLHARWRREPHVIMGRFVKEDSHGKVVYRPRIHRLTLGLTHGSVDDVQYYLNKGFVVLEYWIPSGVDDIPQPQARGNVAVEHGWAAEYKTMEGKARLADVRRLLEQSLRGNSAAVAQEAKIKTLEQRVADAEAKLAKGK